MANTHDNEKDTQEWKKLSEKKVEFDYMNDGLLNFCLMHGFTGENNAPQCSKEDMEWLQKVLESIESEANSMLKIVENLDEYLAELNKGKENSSSETIVDMLIALVDFVEDINNANDFIRMNGQKTLLGLLQHSTDEDILQHVWWILQTLVQNNPIGQLQIYANHDIMLLYVKKFVDYPVDSKKIKELLKSDNLKVVDRLSYALKKFEDEKINSLAIEVDVVF
ncbi:Nucleotide exchange factor Fes1 domain-containing protein [Entamoeba marina]